jgi:hypothetical protein
MKGVRPEQADTAIALTAISGLTDANNSTPAMRSHNPALCEGESFSPEVCPKTDIDATLVCHLDFILTDLPRQQLKLL